MTIRFVARADLANEPLRSQGYPLGAFHGFERAQCGLTSGGRRGCQQRAKEAAASGVRITCSQPKSGGGAAFQEEVSRTYLIHKGLIWVLPQDGGGPAFPSYYSVSGGVLKWRNEAIEFAVRSSRPWHEIHLGKLQEFADGNRLTGPFPCKLERGSLQGL